MIERDYILRMFQLLRKGLARILFLKESGKTEEAALEIDDTSRALLGLTMEMVERMNLTELKRILGSDSALVQSKLYVCGILLKERAGLLEVAGETEVSLSLYMRSLRLLLEEVPLVEDFDIEKRTAAINATILKLDEYELPLELSKQLMAYYEKSGRYDKAEDLIFDIMEEDVSFSHEAFSFYHRLLNKTDTDLQSGNLPREEVEDGMVQLKKKVANFENTGELSGE